MSLFPSTLILCQNKLLADDTVKNLLLAEKHNLDQNPDILIINELSGWGIAQTRTIRYFLAQKPYSHPSRFVIIYQSENLETEAQNALLKILEEPGDNRFIILTCTNKNQLLETIISRCHLIFLANNHEIPTHSIFSQFNSIKEALSVFDTLGTDKTNIKNLLQEELNTLHQSLLKYPNPKIGQKIKILITSLNFIDHHLDPRLALDYYLLKQI
jgi:DNA polymerase III delta prime subunit